MTGASRRLGARRSALRRPACAAASSAISVSALASTTISPGVWPRSTAADPSAIIPGSVASRCIQSSNAAGAPPSPAAMPPQSRPLLPITTSEAERDRRGHPALLRRDQLHSGPQPRLDLAPQCREPFRREEVGLVQDHEIGAGQLIGKDLLERVVVVDRGIGGARRDKPVG